MANAFDLDQVPTDATIAAAKEAGTAAILLYTRLVTREIVEKIFGDHWGSIVVLCEDACAWVFNGTDFATLTVTPSLDASRSGNWHGHITGGQIVGGTQMTPPG